MKKHLCLFIAMAIFAIMLSGCAGYNHLPTSNVNNNVTNVVLASNNFHVVKTVSAETTYKYVLGLGNFKKETLRQNVISDLTKKAGLTGSQALINITFHESSRVFLPFILYVDVTYYAEGTVIEFDGPRTVTTPDTSLDSRSPIVTLEENPPIESLIPVSRTKGVPAIDETYIPQNFSGPKMVDLGLSVKWADRNIGADSPGNPGIFFAWGEVEFKYDFTEVNYQWFKDNVYSNPNGLSDISGSSYDPATKMLGEAWRMPTKSEIQELLDNCFWVWGTSGGAVGYKVTANNGNSIFIPANGKDSESKKSIGVYWSSESPANDQSLAYSMNFSKDKAALEYVIKSSWGGIRPVKRNY